MAVFSGNGSAASPSFTFSSDTNLGLYRAGTDQLAISTAGSERVLFNADGTSTFNQRIDVGSLDESSTTVAGSRLRPEGILWLQRPASTADTAEFINCYDGTDTAFRVETNGSAYFGDQVDIGGTSASPNIELKENGSADFQGAVNCYNSAGFIARMSANTDYPFRVRLNNSDVTSFGGDGRLYIGGDGRTNANTTIMPDGTIHVGVTDGTTLEAGIDLNDDGSASFVAGAVLIDTQANTASSGALQITDGTNVTIDMAGTNGSAYFADKVEVGGTAASPNIELRENGQISAADFIATGVGSFMTTDELRSRDANNESTIIFSTRNAANGITNQGGIRSGGNPAFCIGGTISGAGNTWTPNITLNTSGTVEIGDSAVDTTTGNDGIEMRASGRSTFRDSGNCTVGICSGNRLWIGPGNATSTANRTIDLLPNGDGNFNGTVTDGLSDQALKENIADYSTATQLADIKALQLRTWDWTADAPGTDERKARQNFGLVAQEAEAVDARLSYETSPCDDLNTYKAIDYKVLAMKLLGAVQELTARVEALEG